MYNMWIHVLRTTDCLLFLSAVGFWEVAFMQCVYIACVLLRVCALFANNNSHSVPKRMQIAYKIRYIGVLWKDKIHDFLFVDKTFFICMCNR